MVKIEIIITLFSNFLFINLSLIRLITNKDTNSGFKLKYFIFEEIVLVIWLIFLKKIHKKMLHGYALAIIYTLQVIVFLIETSTIDTVSNFEVLSCTPDSFSQPTSQGLFLVEIFCNHIFHYTLAYKNKQIRVVAHIL